MEIHGCDIVVDTRIPIADSLIRILIQDHWPEMVYEIDEGADFFIYKNEEVKKSWDIDYTTENDADMIYVLFRKDFKEITFVIDDDKKNKYIVDDVIAFIRRCEND